MAADTYYAWSPIRYGEGDVVKQGETVSKAKLSLNDDQWNQLVESTAIRTKKFPEIPETFQGSPVDYARQELADMQKTADTEEIIAATAALTEVESSSPTVVEEEAAPDK